ncbi:type II CRISPR RNA-guided endonuclease Cas9 [Alcaligenaceae bacterium]|nr:type II CRISPR RNA-guided endonuclease Cas9 [Alcaligenaceae bacterium]
MPFRYRLALDTGPTSLGWAIFRLNAENRPMALVLSGVRIFSDGRNPKDGASLAVARRLARAMRRRRDRLLKRKNKLIAALVHHGFFPEDSAQRKRLEGLDPYRLRAEGLDRALEAYEFGRALFHLNQRRGFKSNRKTDKRETDSSVMKSAIAGVREALAEGGFRTVGEWLHHRKQQGQTVRAKFSARRTVTEEGRARIEKNYDLYIDRAMVEAEFDALWTRQAELNPAVFSEQARDELRDILLFQRRLRPVDPGRCTFFPDEARAPLALPSVQRFRLYQELNNLRWLDEGLQERTLTVAQRDTMANALEKSVRRTFQQLRSIAGLGSEASFSVEDLKRQDFKGNATSVVLSKKQHFGACWAQFDETFQDEIVLRLLTEENESVLIAWLQEHTGVDESQAEAIASVALPDGYGRLSLKAIRLILPSLREDVHTYDKAVMMAGIEHHSFLGPRATGEILPNLPYYGKVLERHVGFGTGSPEDSEERRFGRISNPTVHIVLNQIRVLVNELIRRYGHPDQVVVELARELKQTWEQKRETEREQAANQQRNTRYRQEIASVLGISEEQVKRDLIEKRILWEELSFDPVERCCPYSGQQISLEMLLSDRVEVEHILPFSQTLDDSLNNKTVALRQANRVKGNQTPWDAFGRQEVAGFRYEDILQRAQVMPQRKRYRFAQDGKEQWLKNDKGFLDRALNDTRYLSRMAKEYLEFICPQATWVVPGRLTAMLRRVFGLNSPDILGWQGQKNREDHRHHAIDACVIGVTDRGLLQKVADASARGRGMQGRFLQDMPMPWPSYREHVKRAVNRIWVSHKPDHSYEKAMHNDTAYGLLPDGYVRVRKEVDGVRKRHKEKLRVIPVFSAKAGERHGFLMNGNPRPYKGYKGDSNYCIEIVRDDASGKWLSDVISTYQAYQVIREHGQEEGWKRLRDPIHGFSGGSLVMRLMINDIVRLEHENELRTWRVSTISGNGQIFFADIHESNVDSRNRNKNDPFSYASKKASSLQKAKARRVTISPAGRLSDPGFTP